MKKTDGETRTTARFPGLVHTRFVCNWVVRDPRRNNSILPELKDAQEILQNKKAENAQEKNLARNAHIVFHYITLDMIRRPSAEIPHTEPITLSPSRPTRPLIVISLFNHIMSIVSQSSLLFSVKTALTCYKQQWSMRMYLIVNCPGILLTQNCSIMSPCREIPSTEYHPVISYASSTSDQERPSGP